MGGINLFTLTTMPFSVVKVAGRGAGEFALVSVAKSVTESPIESRIIGSAGAQRVMIMSIPSNINAAIAATTK